jgi:hypothetical protein
MDEPGGSAGAAPAPRARSRRVAEGVNGALAVGMAAVHGAFVVVLVGGAVVVVRDPRAWRLHVPAIVAMATVAGAGADCPMTVLESRFRARAGWPSHETGFISHYLIEPWHPAGITRSVRVALIAAWIIPNVTAYGVLARRWHLGRRRAALGSSRR